MNTKTKRILFLLSWLIILAPVYFFYRQLNPIEQADEDRIVFKGILDSKQLTLIEIHAELTNSEPNNVQIKNYQLIMAEGKHETLKAVFLSPAYKNTADYQDVCSGGPTLYSCKLALNTSQLKEGSWLRLKKWNGETSEVRVY